MSYFNEITNYSNETERDIIVGLVGFLTEKIKYDQVSSQGTQEIRVPFYFSLTGDERYIQDFLDTEEQRNGEIATGSYDKIPRGIIKYNYSSAIKSDEMTNPYVRCKFQKEEDGIIKEYFSFFRKIPIELNFEIEVLFDSIISGLKISSEIKRTFYKNRIYQIISNGLRIPCLIVFPEDSSIDRRLEWQNAEDGLTKLTFSITVNSFLYDIVKDSSIFAGNRMHTIVTNVEPSFDLPKDPDKY